MDLSDTAMGRLGAEPVDLGILGDEFVDPTAAPTAIRAGDALPHTSHAAFG